MIICINTPYILIKKEPKARVTLRAALGQAHGLVEVFQGLLEVLIRLVQHREEALVAIYAARDKRLDVVADQFFGAGVFLLLDVDDGHAVFGDSGG